MIILLILLRMIFIDLTYFIYGQLDGVVLLHQLLAIALILLKLVSLDCWME